MESGTGMAAAQQAMVQLAGASQLASGNGDIVVFLPRNLAANIDALVSTGGEHRIEADPALHLNFQNDHANGAGSVHAVAVLNGGGLPLKLKTTAGKIRLQYLDSDPSLRESRIREQEERLRVVNFTQPAPVAAPVPPEGPPANSQSDWLESWVGKLEVAFTGGLREDADDFRKRLTSAPHPPYPELGAARRHPGHGKAASARAAGWASGSFEIAAGRAGAGGRRDQHGETVARQTGVG